MSEKCSPGGGRRVQNEGPEGSWALLGAMWAQGGRRERPKSTARGTNKFNGRLLGASWGEKLIDFSLRGMGRKRPPGLPEAILEASFLGTPPGPKKLRNLIDVCNYF